MKMQNAAFLAALMCVAQDARGQGEAHALVRVPVAARDLPRGQALSEADIKWADTTLSTGVQPAADAVAAGWVARRLIRAGEVLREPGISRPDLVTNGDNVDIIYAAPGVTIKIRGTAIGSGGQGDQVYVKLDNRKRLRAVVAGVNTVRVM